MNKLVIFLFLCRISFQSFASCKDRYLDETKAMVVEDRDLLVVGEIAVAANLAFLYVPAAVVVGGTVATFEIARSIKKNKLKKMIAVIDDAYEFQNSGKESFILNKIKRKIQRGSLKEITLDDISYSIIQANENEVLCDKKNIRKYKNIVSVKLD